ncbi:MAG: hypothetical protein DHS20C02_02120 [Micavibrio sp.]|nr:MAG: hypothetical protein DHS20C02_02120 [Micavibrio sp.]
MFIFGPQKTAEKLDFWRLKCFLYTVFNKIIAAGTHNMFDDLFDFAKKRTLKQSVGFFIFHSALVLTAMAVINMMGAA